MSKKLKPIPQAVAREMVAFLESVCRASDDIYGDSMRAPAVKRQYARAKRLIAKARGDGA